MTDLGIKLGNMASDRLRAISTKEVNLMEIRDKLKKCQIDCELEKIKKEYEKEVTKPPSDDESEMIKTIKNLDLSVENLKTPPMVFDPKEAQSSKLDFLKRILDYCTMRNLGIKLANMASERLLAISTEEVDLIEIRDKLKKCQIDCELEEINEEFQQELRRDNERKQRELVESTQQQKNATDVGTENEKVLRPESNVANMEQDNKEKTQRKEQNQKRQ